MLILQKIPTQNNLREDEIRGATSIIGFLLSLIPVSEPSCNRLCDKGHSLENHVFFSHFRRTQPYSFLCLFSATTSSLWEKSLYLFHLFKNLKLWRYFHFSLVYFLTVDSKIWKKPTHGIYFHVRAFITRYHLNCKENIPFTSLPCLTTSCTVRCAYRIFIVSNSLLKSAQFH